VVTAQRRGWKGVSSGRLRALQGACPRLVQSCEFLDVSDLKIGLWLPIG
jgi:hypothetical protein